MKSKPELEQLARELVVKGLDSLASRAESPRAQQLATYWTDMTADERSALAAKIVEGAESVLASVPFAAIATAALPGRRRAAKAAPRKKSADDEPKKKKTKKSKEKEKKNDQASKDKKKDKKKSKKK